MKYKDLEEKRKKYAHMTLAGIIILASIFPMFFIIGSLGFKVDLSFVFVLFAISGIVLISIGLSNVSKIAKEFKGKIITELVKEILGEDSRYMPSSGLSLHDVCSSRIVCKKDRFHSEDLIMANYEGVDIRTSDVLIEERHVTHTKNGTQVTYVPTFVGRFFALEFKKQIPGCVCLSEGDLKGEGLEKIKLESMEFNKKFKICADSQHNAFFILTPHVMESIMKIEEKYKGHIGVQFEGNEVFIAINNGIDTFKVSMFKKIDEKYINKFRSEIMCITDLIQAIKVSSQYKGE